MQNRVVKRKGRKVALIRDSGALSERRSQIAEAALDLFLGNGYHNTNVREIALASKISVGSLFNYFTNKEEILFYVLDHGQNAIETGLTELTDKLTQSISEHRSA
jgi:AcrR family transcriptional regulator